MAEIPIPLFQPTGPSNDRLRKNVRPPDWRNPVPRDRYDLVVIGAGSGGLVTAAGAAGLGARVALVEKHALGGDCLNVGCVPSKALIASARAAAAARDGGKYGVRVEGVEVDFEAVMERMRRLRAEISPNDSAERFTSLGVDVFLGEARFIDRSVVAVGDEKLRFSRAVIATGARAIVLPIPGLAEAGALTNETLFSLTKLPARLAVIGAGPIGCEMAQAFARFGSRVSLFETEKGILPRDDPDASAIVRSSLEADGVEILCGAGISSISASGALRMVEFQCEGSKRKLECDAVLLGVGRAPNVEDMGLEVAGVRFDTRRGVEVDDMLRTSNKRIFAVGDVCMSKKFTHMADATARIVIQNALFGGRARHTDLIVPSCTYTEPEIANVGIGANEARELGSRVKTFTQDFSELDRALLDGRSEGFVRVHARNGKILGATIVGADAGNMISELTVAMKAGATLATLSSTIHPYPTTAEAIRRIGDAYNRTRLTPLVKRVMNWIIRIRR